MSAFGTSETFPAYGAGGISVDPPVHREAGVMLLEHAFCEFDIKYALEQNKCNGYVPDVGSACIK